MKKKLSVGLVLAIVLILVTVAAVAATVITAAQEKAVRFAMEQEAAENHYFSTWPPSARINLTEMLIEADFAFPEAIIKSFQNETDEKKKNVLVDDLLIALYGRADIMGELLVMQTIMGGPFQSWNYETKAWYYTLTAEYDLPISKYEKYSLPQPEDIQYEEAIALAKDILKEKYGMNEKDLDDAPISAAFCTHYQLDDEFVWQLHFYDSEKMEDSYTLLLSRHGELIGSAHPGQDLQFENMEYPDETWDAIPSNYDIPKEQALILANGALTEIVGYSAEEADRLIPIARFHYSPEFCHGTEPVWLITYSDPDAGTALYKVLLGYDGSFIEVSEAASYFKHPYRRGGAIASLSVMENEKGEDFFNWSVEDKAAFSQKWIPIAEKHKLDNPYFTGEGDFIWTLTRRIFGLPTPQDITQEEALELALKAARELGATDALIKRLTSRQFYFDVTDSTAPQWRIIIHRYADDSQYQDGDETCFFIKIDARKGAVISIQQGGLRPFDFLSKP